MHHKQWSNKVKGDLEDLSLDSMGLLVKSEMPQMLLYKAFCNPIFVVGVGHVMLGYAMICRLFTDCLAYHLHK